jgi:putative ABC transport system substrate-binding protein
MMATELIGRDIDLIVAPSTPAARAARQATSTIPIVAFALGDAVEDGLVSSLARPGGNVTGLTFLARRGLGRLEHLAGSCVR